MLGIDIGEKTIRVVYLRRKGSGFVLQPPLTVPLEAGYEADAAGLGKKLEEALKSRGWQKKKAVMTLPGRHCFIRRLSVDRKSQHISESDGHLTRTAVENLLNIARQSMLVPSEDLVLDLWNKPGVPSDQTSQPTEHNGVILMGAARKSVVEFYRELSSSSGIKVQSLELRSLASVNGLLLNWHEAPEENIAVVYLDTEQADVAFFDAKGLVSLQVLNFSGSGDQSGGEDGELLEQLPRVLNTLRLSEPECVPQRLFLGAGSAMKEGLETLAARLQQRTGIEITVCSSNAGLTMQELNIEAPDISDFQPARGAALDGLAASPTWFDFMHPRGRISEKKKPVSWRPFVLAAVISMFMGGIFWLYLVQQKITERDGLRYSHDLMQPNREKMLEAKQNWSLFRSYLPSAKGGDRLSYLNILYEISRLMPDPNEAYITDLTITGTDQGGLAAKDNININGRISQRDVLTGFIERLNDSEMFQEAKQAGPQSRVTSDLLYPVSFSVTSKLGRSEGGAAKP